jgi:hypothetical protein
MAFGTTNDNNDDEKERTLEAAYHIEDDLTNLYNEVWGTALSEEAWKRIDHAVDTGEIIEPRGPRAASTSRALIHAAYQHPSAIIQMWMETRDRLVDTLLELRELKQSRGNDLHLDA